jgi:uncharacterized coiled-coil protein SlyX
MEINDKLVPELLHSLLNSIAWLEQELQESRGEVAGLEAKLSEVEIDSEKLEELELQVAARDATIDEQKATITELQNQLSMRDQQLRALSKQYCALEGENRELSGRVERLKAENDLHAINNGLAGRKLF